MTETKFVNIAKINDKGIAFLDNTLRVFAKNLPDYEYDELRDSLITLVQSQRIDAGTVAIEYMQKYMI